MHSDHKHPEWLIKTSIYYSISLRAGLFIALSKFNHKAIVVTNTAIAVVWQLVHAHTNYSY